MISTVGLFILARFWPPFLFVIGAAVSFGTAVVGLPHYTQARGGVRPKGNAHAAAPRHQRFYIQPCLITFTEVHGEMYKPSRVPEIRWCRRVSKICLPVLYAPSALFLAGLDWFLSLSSIWRCPNSVRSIQSFSHNRTRLSEMPLVTRCARYCTGLSTHLD